MEPTLRKVLARYPHIRRLVVVADRGLLSLDNIEALTKLQVAGERPQRQHALCELMREPGALEHRPRECVERTGEVSFTGYATAPVHGDAHVAEFAQPRRPEGVRQVAVDRQPFQQVAHHLDEDSCITVFRECDRVARIGVIVADLHRSVAAQAGFWVASHALGFDRVTRVDGMTSLRRGFTAGSLRQLLQRTGVDARVERRPGSRLVATWNKATGPQHRSIR